MRYSDKDGICYHHSAIARLHPQYQIVKAYHKQKFGRDDMEYAAFIEKDGLVIWHPDGFRAVLYSAGEFNERIVGVCVAGHLGQELLTSAQVRSLVEVTDIIKNSQSIKHLWNHRELRKTSCPKINLRSVVEKEIERRRIPIRTQSFVTTQLRAIQRGINRSVGRTRDMLIRKRARLLHRIEARHHDHRDCCPES